MTGRNLLQHDGDAKQLQSTIQTEASGAPGKHRLKHIFVGTVAGLGLLVAGIFGIQALTDAQPTAGTGLHAPVDQVAEDPPLPAGWIDPYFAHIPDHLAAEDPPLPDGWVDPYFNRPVDLPVQEDPPLPEGWVDPYFRDTD